MSATKTLNKVKAVLGLEVSLEQKKLDNGTVIEADSFEQGQSVFIVTEDDRVALPIGSYEIEDGTLLVIEEDGIIASIGEAEAEEIDEEVTEEVEAEDHEKEEKMEYVSKDEFYTALEEIKGMIEKMTNTEEKMSEEVQEEAVEESLDAIDESVEVSEAEELKAELSKPATEPLKHSPKEETAWKAKFNFNKNKSQTAYDRIVGKISNIKQQ